MTQKKRFKTVTSRLPQTDEWLEKMVNEMGYNLEAAFYSCHDGMYHYLFSWIEYKEA